jgi:RNA-directed DNA polymerase
MEQYHIYRIKKKSGKFRKICAPCAELKAVQRTILKDLEQRFQAHPCATGFVRGKSIVDNAQVHCAPGTWLLNLDLSDFFDSIHRNQLYPLFLDLGIDPIESLYLCNQCTLPGAGHLPQGAVTSPFLSNLYCRALDQQLSELCQNNHLQYTRYADDMTISGDREDILLVFPAVRQIIRSHRLVINEKKVKLIGPGKRQEVTGINVSTKISCGREHYQQLRTAIHRLNKALNQGRVSPENQLSILGMTIEQLMGEVGFVTFVNPSLISLKNDAKTLYSRLRV